jgi:purine-nucleoside phosphorylase
MNQEKVNQTALFLKKWATEVPKVAIVLGSGWSTLVDSIQVTSTLSYNDIPGFNPVGVEGHKGTLVLGRLSGVPVFVMQGRYHFYEGHPWDEVVLPHRSLAVLGVENFILTNAVGGLNPKFKPSELVLIKDHLNLTGSNPLIGKNLPEWGPRFPDMTEVYDSHWRRMFSESARKLKIPLSEGVYVGLQGPAYETPAEVRMYQMLGGDVVGMSTVPEAICLRHMKKKVVGISCVTNPAAGLVTGELDHKDVLESAEKGVAYGQKLFEATLSEWRSNH